jgi:lysophospholipase L1-like esterase
MVEPITTTRTGRESGRIARRALAILCFVWPFALIELAVELAGCAPADSGAIQVWLANDQGALDGLGEIFEPDDDLLWSARPGSRYFGEEINADGRRGDRLPRTRGARPRIVTLGDSSTFGFGVMDEQCFTRRIEQAFRERGTAVETINLGTIGYSAVQALRAYETRGRDYRPDLVIAAVGAVNEHFIVGSDRTDLRRLEALKANDGKFVRWVHRFSTVRWIASWFKKSSSFAETPEAVDQMLSQHAVRELPRVSVSQFSRALSDLAAAVAADGGRLLLVVPPRRADAEVGNPALIPYSDALRAFCAERAIPLADVYAAFRQLDNADEAVRANAMVSPRFLDAYHPSVSGHVLYAEVLVAAIDRLGLLAP